MTTWDLGRAEEHLLSLELFGMRFGLERMRRLLTEPPRRFAPAVAERGLATRVVVARPGGPVLLPVAVP